MNKIYLLLIILFFLGSSFGCGSDSERGIKDSREHYMAMLKDEFTKQGIPFELDEEGYVRYSKSNYEAVEAIKKKIERSIENEVGTKFDDKNSTEYFRGLLEKEGILYRTETRSDGEWTFWRPESNIQQEEIEMKVVTQAFQNKK